MTDATIDGRADPEPHVGHTAAAAHKEGQQHPLRLYFVVWGWLFVLSTCSYMVDYFGLEGRLRWSLILIFMVLKAGLIIAVFMHMAWERLALAYAILLPMIVVLVFVAIMTSESDYTLFTREAFFGLLSGQEQHPVNNHQDHRMVYDVLVVVLRTLLAVVSGAILAFGFAFLIFLGDADARDKPLVSRRFDKLAMLTVYLSWFGLLAWFGFSERLLMVACGATVILCLVYAASYQTAASRQPSTPL